MFSMSSYKMKGNIELIIKTNEQTKRQNFNWNFGFIRYVVLLIIEFIPPQKKLKYLNHLYKNKKTDSLIIDAIIDINANIKSYLYKNHVCIFIVS
jgi:hypothetical protein